MEKEEYNVYSFEGLNDTLLDFANEMRFGGDLNVTFKFVEATKSDLLSLYNSNAICWEGINLKERVPLRRKRWNLLNLLQITIYLLSRI